jgi:hypothetical protein
MCNRDFLPSCYPGFESRFCNAAGMRGSGADAHRTGPLPLQQKSTIGGTRIREMQTTGITGNVCWCCIHEPSWHMEEHIDNIIGTGPGKSPAHSREASGCHCVKQLAISDRLIRPILELNVAGWGYHILHSLGDTLPTHRITTSMSCCQHKVILPNWTISGLNFRYPQACESFIRMGILAGERQAHVPHCFRWHICSQFQGSYRQYLWGLSHIARVL